MTQKQQYTTPFTIYGASAGSGKTFTLVKSYLKLLLGSDNPAYFKHILAITFTNKATAEMKSRIVEALNAFANEKVFAKDRNKSLFEALKSELQLSGEVLRKKSRRIFTALLHNYNDFSVSTIDKFNHRIVRTFAYDLHLPLNFEVSLLQEEIIGQAVDLVINKVGGKDEEATQIAQALLTYISYKMQGNENWKFESQLNNFAVKLLKDANIFLLKRLESQTTDDRKDFLQLLKDRKREIENDFQDAAESFQKFVEQNGYEASDFAGKTKGVFGWHNKIKSGEFKPTETAKKAIANDDWLSKEGLKKTFSSEFESIKLKYVHILESYSEYKSLDGIIKNMSLLQLLSSIQKSLSQVKKDENILNLSDFNRLISEIVENEPMPFIYERLGEHYQHYMIDEFQDTSSIQWANLMPLLENSLAYQHLNLIVGDPKQAIYRFRDGDVQQFVDLIKAGKGEAEDKNQNVVNSVIEEKLTHLKNQASFQDLDTNYRSKKEIIQFNNRFFSYVRNSLSGNLIKDAYADATQKFSEENSGGDVRIKIIPKPEKGVKQDKNLLYSEAVLDYIKECLELGYSYNDIAVLVITKKNGAVIAEFLKENNIPIVSSETLLLNKNPTIQLLINTLTYLSNENDDEAQAKLVISLNENNLISESLPIALAKMKSDKFYLKNILSERSISTESFVDGNLYTLTEKLANQFNLLEDKADAYLQSFLDCVFQFTQEQSQDLSEFLAWWDEKKEKLAVKTSGNVDAVQIMTIHKSKGLEFPVVIYPFAESNVKLTKNYALVDYKMANKDELALLNVSKGLEETRFEPVFQDENEKSTLDLLNIVYVACTRAVNRLFLITEAPAKDPSGTNINQWFSGFIKSGDMPFIEDVENTFSYAKPTQKAEKVEEKSREKTLERFIYGDWKEKIKVSYQWVDAWLNDDNEKSSRSYGRLIHNILSFIKSEKDIESVLERFILKGIIQSEEKTEIETQIRQMISNPENKAYFNASMKIKTEASILSKEGKIYRPDRIVEGRSGNITIIDFKTGSKKNQHEQQVAQYAELLREMGNENVETRVVYL